ncbi:AMP-binding protein [Yinghuangia aomiensis]
MSPDAPRFRLTALLDPRPGDADTVAIHSDVREVTRAELRAGALALADLLRSVGVRPGRAVAVMSADGADTVAALFGVWFADAVYVPLNPRLTDRELAHVLGEVRPAAIVADSTASGRFPGRAVVEAHGRGGSYAWAARAVDPSRGRGGASTVSAVPDEAAASAEPSRDQAAPPPPPTPPTPPSSSSPPGPPARPNPSSSATPASPRCSNPCSPSSSGPAASPGPIRCRT